MIPCLENILGLKVTPEETDKRFDNIESEIEGLKKEINERLDKLENEIKDSKESTKIDSRRVERILSWIDIVKRILLGI